jgi:hypothetical protein
MTELLALVVGVLIGRIGGIWLDYRQRVRLAKGPAEFDAAVRAEHGR